MQISGTGITNSALGAAAESFRKADLMLLRAVEAVEEGDIVDAALSVNEAKITAKSGAAVARAAIEVSGMILDVFA